MTYTERESQTYKSWLKTIKVGDTVTVRHPWQDKETPGGRLSTATVVKVIGNIIVAVDNDEYGHSYNFHSTTGRTGPYEYLEMEKK